MSAPKITFIGAGSTIFVKNILGDVFHRDALNSAHIALMDLDPTRLEESHVVVRKLMDSAGASGRITCYTDQKAALQDADFVVVAFQIGGYEPCTVTDFTVCKRNAMVWSRRLPTRWGREALCARCAPFRIYGRFVRI